jgi:cytochrome c peroxidase
MLFPKWIRCKLWFVVVTTAATIFAGVQMLLAAKRETKAPSPGMATATPAKLSPIPVPDSLAQPRSLRQFGIPDLQTLAEIPEYNPQTPEKIALGEKLFFEPRLSADQTVACASCHNPDRAFTDGRPTSVGFKGRVGQRNASTILNALYNKSQFWGRVA